MADRTQAKQTLRRFEAAGYKLNINFNAKTINMIEEIERINSLDDAAHKKAFDLVIYEATKKAKKNQTKEEKRNTTIDKRYEEIERFNVVKPSNEIMEQTEARDYKIIKHIPHVIMDAVLPLCENLTDTHERRHWKPEFIDLMHINMGNFEQYFGQKTENVIIKAVNEMKAVKLRIGVQAMMEKLAYTDVSFDEFGNHTYEREISTHYFNIALPTAIINIESIKGHLTAAFRELHEAMDHFDGPSGGVLLGITNVYIRMDKYRVLKGGLKMATPKFLVNKHCCINIISDDNECFRRSLIACIDRPAKNTERHTYYDKEIRRDMFDLTGFTFPVSNSIKMYKKFEEQNEDFALNVFKFPNNGESLNDLEASYISDQDPGKTVLTLILLYDYENKKLGHYIAVSDQEALLANPANRNLGRTCPRCFHSFCSNDAVLKLNEHLPICRGINHDYTKIKMPEEGTKYKFNKFDAINMTPYIVIADFEATLINMSEKKGEKSKRTNEHIANSYGYMVIGPNDSIYKPLTIYRGLDATEHFIRTMRALAIEVQQLLNRYPKHNLSEEEKTTHKNTNKCYLCNAGDFTFNYGTDQDKTNNKIIEHCHTTGEYRGAAHQKCNNKCRVKNELPVFIHNLKGYDAHLIMQKMHIFDDKIDVIATNTENYISFSQTIKKCETEDEEHAMKIIFKDSYALMNGSLAAIVANTPPEKLKYTKEFADSRNIDMKLLTRKGVYPYNWLDDIKKFDVLELPNIECFYDNLNCRECKEEDYLHAEYIWKSANCKNFGDYHDLYLYSDVSLLADVFQNFRHFAKEKYDLDPAQFYTLPGFSWAALFKHTGAELDILSDPNMYMAFEEIRGGLCVASNRYVKANLPHIEGYDETKPNKYIRYDDANNLYGWAMCQALPYKNFTWGNSEEWNEEKILLMDDEAERGAHFQVDIEYPEELHDAHADFPLLPESKIININQLSDKIKIPEKYKPCKKLIATLENKYNYWVHSRNLKYALQQGLKLIKIHKVIEYDQKPWMASYINYNTEQRKTAKSDFEKDLFKLLNNAVFGKTMQNLRRQRDIMIMKPTDPRYVKVVSKPTFRNRINMDDLDDGSLCIIERTKQQLTLNMPMYVGNSILDLSKLHMWKFWYDYIRVKYPQAKLHYTDTDSLIYSIETNDDIEAVFKGVKSSLFDTSDYPKDSPNQCNDNKKVIGMFKSETEGKLMSEVICLRPKSYTCIINKGKTIKKNKGTQKCIVKDKITPSDYKNCLDTGVGHAEVQRGFRHDKHRIYSVESTKECLSSFDSKRFWINNIESLPFGHYKAKNGINKNENIERTL